MASPEPKPEATPTAAMPAQVPASRLDWTLFVVLSFMWGSSYLFIRIGVDEGLRPLTLVMLRLAFGSLLLIGVVVASRQPLPRDLRTYGHLVVMAILSIVTPFWLITYGEQTVDSSLASILNATVPLFTIVIAALFLHDEPITVNRLVGLGVGFFGVVVLTGGSFGAPGADGVGFGVLALILSSIAYAAGNVYTRRNVRGLPPMTIAVFQVTFAFVITTVLALLLEDPLSVTITPTAALSVVWLGLLGSGMAYLLFFRMLGRWGSTRSSLVAYLLPVWGIVLGALVLDETIDAGVLAGTALVIGGVAVASSRLGARRLFGRSTPAVE
jgi:drug/metabolite transporter (DMT)-like permease